MPAFTAVAVAAVGPARIATAIGISAMFRQVGGAVGVAMFVALVGSPARAVAIEAYRRGWALKVAGGADRRGARRAAPAPPPPPPPDPPPPAPARAPTPPTT